MPKPIREGLVRGKPAHSKPDYITGSMCCSGRIYVDYAMNAVDWARKHNMHLSEIITAPSGARYEIYHSVWPEMAVAIPVL